MFNVARLRIRQIAIGITALAAIGATALIASIAASPAAAAPTHTKPYAGNIRPPANHSH